MPRAINGLLMAVERLLMLKFWNLNLDVIHKTNTLDYSFCIIIVKLFV